MNEGFSAFKALAWGIGALFVAATVVPESGAHFDPIRILKRTTGKGKGKIKPAPVPTEPTSPTSPTSPTPTEPPPPTTTPAYAEETIVPSNFDINSELVPAALPPSMGVDVVGAFRFICGPGRLLYDDPIVYPGQPGRSHLHQFYGNTAVDAHSTTYKLRTEGQSTCMSPLNRSAYWMPAMLDGRGNVVRPDYVTIYYKRRPASDPMCQRQTNPSAYGICVPLPNGLKYVFGFDMLTGKSPTGQISFNCDGPGAVPGNYPDMVTAAKNCPSGARLGAIIHSPPCWDGKNLDSPNHRDHVAYSGVSGCPSTHPYLLPVFTMGAWYTTDASLDRSGTWEAGRTVTWHFSSDAMPGMPPARPGTTFHADWWGAWDNTVMAMWTDNCINKKLSCAAGNLGNGKAMRWFSGFSWTANPRLVPIP
jgi:uncharacterized protein DUF1996